MKGLIVLSICLSLALLPAEYASSEDPVVQLTFDATGNYDPAWSPDGTQILFRSDRTGFSDLWLIPSAGGAATPGDR